MALTDPTTYLDAPETPGGRTARFRGPGMPRPASRAFDMPRVAENDEEMLRFTQELEDASIEYQQLIIESAQAAIAFKKAWTTAFLQRRHVKPLDQRKAESDDVTFDEYEVHMILDARVRSFPKHLDALKLQVEVRRTLAANFRTQVGS